MTYGGGEDTTHRDCVALSGGETNEGSEGSDSGEELHVVYVFGIGGEWSSQCGRANAVEVGRWAHLLYTWTSTLSALCRCAPSYQCILIEVETLSVCSLGSVMETITHVSLPIWSDESVWWQINPERDLGSLYANGQ